MTLPEELNPKTATYVNDDDLDAFIQRHLGRVWVLQQNGDFANNSTAYFQVAKDPEVTAAVQRWLESPPARMPGRIGGSDWNEAVQIYTHEILNELCNRGLLPEGTLEVRISW